MILTAAGAACVLAATARSEDSTTLTPGRLRFDLQSRADEEPPVRPFGKQGETRLTIGTGVGIALENDDDSTDYNLNVAWSEFIVDNVEVRLEFGAWYFDQEHNATAGFNPNFVLRWHFVNEDPWSVYADAGIGLLLAGDDVPVGGTSFDFMPRVGVGVTHRLDARDDRLEFGVRWHHISNARITGDARNPDRDGIMFYAGISFPI